MQTLVLRIKDTYHSVAAVEVVEDEGVVRAVVKDRVSVVFVLDLYQEETRSRELWAPVVFNLKHTSARVWASFTLTVLFNKPRDVRPEA